MNAGQARQLINSTQHEFLQLIYPERIVLGWADILTGFAISGALHGQQIQLFVALGFLLLVATIMSGGGAILARIFFTRGKITNGWEIRKSDPLKDRNSIAIGIILLSLAGLSALWVSSWAALFTVAIAISAFAYSLWSTKQPFYALISFALYRTGSILLGMSIIPTALQQRWCIVLIPIVYLAIAVLYSQRKVNESIGNNELPIVLMILIVFESLFLSYFLPGYDIFKALLFTIILAQQILPPYFKSLYEPASETIELASNGFWTGIFLLDATIAAGFSNWYYALLVLSMLPLAKNVVRLTTALPDTTTYSSKN